jgi:hypothetical protein
MSSFLTNIIYNMSWVTTPPPTPTLILPVIPETSKVLPHSKMRILQITFTNYCFNLCWQLWTKFKEAKMHYAHMRTVWEHLMSTCSKQQDPTTWISSDSSCPLCLVSNIFVHIPQHATTKLYTTKSIMSGFWWPDHHILTHLNHRSKNEGWTPTT